MCVLVLLGKTLVFVFVNFFVYYRTVPYMFKLLALLWEEFFCSHIFTYRFAPHRFRNQQCGCVATGQSISAAPANVTTTTVKQKCLSGRSPRNGMTGKHLHVICFYNDSIDNGLVNL